MPASSPARRFRRMADSFSSELVISSALSSGALRAPFSCEAGAGVPVPAAILLAGAAQILYLVENKSGMMREARVAIGGSRVGRGCAVRFSFSPFGESSTNFVKNFPGFPESWIRNPLICLAMGQPGARRVGGSNARNPCQIQHVVQRSVLKSICSREHTVNRNESSIRRRFVPWLFLSSMPPTTTGGAKGWETPDDGFSCRRPLRLARRVGMCLPPA